MLAASYAKINLFLEVTGKLPNNYHQVNTVLCSIDLCDIISYAVTDQNVISLTCSDPALSNPDNLLFKVAHYLKQQYSIVQGVQIHLDKHIPVAAGLGGGSSNAANCIIALNKLWNLKLSLPEMHSIAAKFGSDINFFLEGGCALGENRGEQITPLPDIAVENLLLINPNLYISSSSAYQLVELPSPQERRFFDPHNLKGSCFNRLEPGIRKEYPAIDGIITSLERFGAEVAMMSGSGSTCFGIFSDPNSLLTCSAYFAGKGYWTKMAHTLPRI